MSVKLTQNDLLRMEYILNRIQEEVGEISLDPVEDDDGNEYWQCGICGEYFDGDTAGAAFMNAVRSWRAKSPG